MCWPSQRILNMPSVTLIDMNKLLKTSVHIQKVTEHDVYNTGTWVPYKMISNYL